MLYISLTLGKYVVVVVGNGIFVIYQEKLFLYAVNHTKINEL